MLLRSYNLTARDLLDPKAIFLHARALRTVHIRGLERADLRSSAYGVGLGD
jgi:hypothetical protein